MCSFLPKLVMSFLTRVIDIIRESMRKSPRKQDNMDNKKQRTYGSADKYPSFREKGIITALPHAFLLLSLVGHLF